MKYEIIENLQIILTAHKLIYMADTIADCISSGDVSREMKRAADRLLDVLKTCVQATKHAADEVCNFLVCSIPEI